MRWSVMVADGGFSWRAGCCFDPMTLTAGAMAASAVGSAASAAGTLAGGQMAAEGGAAQQVALKNQGASAFASSERQALDARQRARLAISSSTANAAASGVDAGEGSPAANTGELARRGSYQALMDIYNGQSRGDALRYEGDVANWQGQARKSASVTSALGTVAGGAGNMLRMYGATRYPNVYGRPGASF